MSWDYESIERQLAEYVGEASPDDPKERTRRRILAAATDHFVRLGYRKTSVDDVARQAGVAKGTVYLYFKSKADLLVHAVAVEKARHVERLRPVFDPALAPRERLRMYLDLVLRLASEMPLVSRLARGDADYQHLLDELDAGERARGEAAQDDFAAWLLGPFAAARGWSEADVRERGRMLLALFSVAGSLVEGPDRVGLPRDRFAELLAATLADGLAPPPGSDR